VGADITKGIQKIGATEFNVDRGVVDKILENQAELMRQRALYRNRRTARSSAFGCSALAGHAPRTLGMENGDRLEKINGFDMTSPEKALEA